MFTDLSAATARTDQRQRARFRRYALVLILALLVGAIGLGVVNAVQGPRVSYAEVNPQAVITRADQRMLIHANQPLAAIDAAQLEISPATPADLSVDGNTITVQFGAMLDYDTEYAVTVRDARGSFTGLAASLSHSFTTPDVSVYSLLRDPDSGNDRVLRHSISGDVSHEVVFQAPRIQEYATVTDNLVAAVTLDEDDVPALVLATTSDGSASPVSTPAASVIRDLRASRSGDVIGFVLDSAGGPELQEYSSVLFSYDFNSSTGLPTPVLGLDGEPLQVIDWTFVPGTTSIVAQGPDQQMFLVDSLTGSATSVLGQHAEIRGFLPGSPTLVVADPLSGSTIDLTTGTTTILELPEPQVAEELHPGKLVMVGADSYVQLFTDIGTLESPRPATSALYLTGPDGTTELFRPASDSGRIRDLCISPNAEYLAVEVVASDATPDAYPVLNGYAGTTTYYVRLADGSFDRGVNGFLSDWCR